VLTPRVEIVPLYGVMYSDTVTQSHSHNNPENNPENNLENNLGNNLENNLGNNLENNLGNNLENNLDNTSLIYNIFWQVLYRRFPHGTRLNTLRLAT
jgi:hypothetical protein